MVGRETRQSWRKLPLGIGADTRQIAAVSLTAKQVDDGAGAGPLLDARAEAGIGRWGQIIGDALRAHKEKCRATEVGVAVHALNRMWELARPNDVRIA